MSVKFIAEVSSNHHQDLSRCLCFIDKAAEIGCDTIKFQLFKINELFAPEILKKSEMHRKREAWELPIEFVPSLAKRCQEVGIQFSCTPFYLRAVDELFPYVDFYKIASYELLWEELLKTCAQTGKPMVLSTGMATLKEIDIAVQTVLSSGCKNLTLLHCISGYPTPINECNLSVINTLKNKFNCEVGWSDHSVSPAVIFRAVYHWEATIIEYHMDLDREGHEYQNGHCWLPEQIQPVIKLIKEGYHADGNGNKTPAPSELQDRDWRADPSDGLRPLVNIRRKWKGI